MLYRINLNGKEELNVWPEEITETDLVRHLTLAPRPDSNLQVIDF